MKETDTINNSQKKPVDINSTAATSPTNKLLLLPIILTIAVLPLLVIVQKYNTNLADYSWFPTTPTSYDAFLKFKQTFLIIIAVCMTFVLAFQAYRKKSLKFRFLYVPLIVYVALALLSTLFSEYRIFGLAGIRDQFESIFVIMGYGLISYYSYLFIRCEEDVRYVMKALLTSIAIMSILGLTQLTGHDFFASDLGKGIMNIGANNVNISVTLETGRVYLSLYNPNYVGVYVSLLAPILIMLLLYTKQLKLGIYYGLLLIGLFLALVGSESKTGILILLITVLFVILLARKQLFKHYKIYLPIILVAIVASVAVLVKTDLLTQVSTALTTKDSEVALTHIDTNDDNVSITYKGNILNLQFVTDLQSQYIILASDESGTDIPLTVDTENSCYVIEDERFQGFLLQPVMVGEQLGFCVNIDGNNWYFTNVSDDGSYYFINHYGRLVKINEASGMLFNDHLTFASGRGYIWSRTLPLLQDKLLLGSGADTFLLVFPNDDYVNLYNYGFDGQLMSKPHNLYLQMAVQSGVLSLVAFLIFYLWYFISSLRIYMKSKLDTYMKQVGAGIFAGTIGYMISGITNDSSITVAPIFWGLIGIGIGINYLVKRHETIA